MNEYIYRYIDLATLLNLVQTKTLTFVLPTVWEDTYENKFFDEFVRMLDYPDNGIAKIFVNLCYAQCWTHLAESDAMWRIYDYNNRSLRIKICVDDVNKLKNVFMRNVEYSDEIIDYKKLYPDFKSSQLMLNAISQKRKAFRHEEEVRLIYFDKKTDEEFNSVIQTVFPIITSQYRNITGNEEIVELDIEKLLRDITNFNICQDNKIQSVSFEHIDNFIKGVMVNPHAPDWYVDTISKYCELNDIPFEGKSTLYQKIGEVDDNE